MKRLIVWLFALLPFIVFAQETRKISGTVVGAEGETLPGASVFVDKNTIGEASEIDGVVKNFSIGTTTDIDGKFELELPINVKELRCSFIGYKTKTIAILGKQFVKIVLEEDQSVLDEVIVTGYQKIEKRKLTSAIVEMDMDVINTKGVSSVDQMLQGQTSGVMITPETGSPGQLSSIRIRGTSSINAIKDPLWVIDGMPLEGNDVPDLSDKNNITDLKSYSIAGINPDDIASITILKDASATSIYGARAANGVILVTTKKGKKGKMHVSLNANTFINFMPNYNKINLMNSNEKVDFELSLAKRDDLSYKTSNGEVARILNAANELNEYRKTGKLTPETLAKIDALRNNNIDWWKELYRTSVNQQYTASVSGGSDLHDYYFSVGYYNDQSALKEDGFDRINFTLKNNFRINDKLKIGVSLLGTSINKKSFLTDAGAFTNPNLYSRNVNPYQLIKDAEGDYIYDKNIDSNLGSDVDFIKFNIIEERENTRNELKSLQLKGVFDLEYEFIKGLKYKTLFGIQLENSKNERWASENSYYNRTYKGGTRFYNREKKVYEYWLPEGSIVSNQSNDFFQYMWRNSVEFEKRFGKHDINLLGGVEIRHDNTDRINTRAFGVNDKTLTSTPVIFRNEDDATNAIYRPYKKEEYENAYASFFGTASYTYDNKYTIFGSVRFDGSNLFGVDPKYRYLPIWSVSGAWNVDREDFFKENIDWISQLRLRTSYGFQGNIDRSSSPYVVGTYGTTSIIPGTTEERITVLGPPNDKLRWEKTQNFGVGVDLGLLNNRINFIFDWYKRNSTDLITTKTLPLETGFTLTPINYGELTNKGLEFTLSTVNVKTDDWLWTTSINLSKNENKIEKTQFNTNPNLPRGEGYPVDAIWTVPYAGLDNDGLPTFNKDGKTLSTVEFYRLYDPWAAFYPGNSAASAYSREEAKSLLEYRGSRSPKWYGGISSTVSYKDFDFGISGSFTYKRTALARPAYDLSRVNPGSNYAKDILDAWTPENKTNSPRIVGKRTIQDALAYNWFNSSDYAGTYYMFSNLAKDLTYFRITSMKLGYNLPKKYLEPIGISGLRVSVEGRNLFVFSNGYDGYFDPETYGNIYAQPIQKSISFGVNVEF